MLHLTTLSTDELLNLRNKVSNEVVALNARQEAYKLSMNSFYGILAMRYSVFCNYDMSLCVTSSGRAVVYYVGCYINQTLNSYGFKDCWFYGDTDSNYYTLNELVEKYYENNVPSFENYRTTVDFILKLANKKIQPLIDEALLLVSKLFNAEDVQAKEQFLKMKLEIIAFSLFQKAKKKYAALKFYDEGEFYDNPKKKIMGLDLIRRETPKFVKSAMNTSLDLLLKYKKKELSEFNKNLRFKFMNASLADIAIIKPGNNMRKYYTVDGSIISRTPSHVVAILRYNRLLKELNISHLYDEIREGDRCYVIYLKMPNPIKLKYIAWPITGTLPVEFKLEKYIDRTTQFDKVYMKKVKEWTDLLSWEYSDKRNLSNMLKELK